jgi:regulator of sigma E protease
MDIVATLTLIVTLIFWFVIIVIPLVIVHEFGHTIMSWLFKIRVVEYGVGMPPRTPIKFRFRKMLYSLNWLPLGGFAKIYGDHDALDNAVSDMPTKGSEVKDQYVRERLLEVVDGDLPALLENNGLEYTEEWKKFELVMQKNSWITNLYLKDGALTKGWNAGGKALPEAEAKMVEGNVKQLEKLMLWELEGMKHTKTAFFNRGFLPKFVVLIGGVLFNYLFAWLIIFGLLNFGSIQRVFVDASTLVPLSNNFTVSQEGLNSTIRVQKDSVLDKAGVHDRDKLISYNGKDFKEYGSFADFREAVKSTEGKETQLVYLDNKTKEQKTVTLSAEKKEDGSYKIGAVLLSQQSYKAKDFGSSFAAATEETNNAVGQIWNGLVNVFKALLPSTQDKSALDSVGGPIAIASYGSLTFELLGAAGILYIIALVSLSLAVFNLLPLPVLDGGRIVLAAINKITGNRNRKLEAVLINGTMILMLALFVLIAFRDVGTVRNIFG